MSFITNQIIKRNKKWKVYIYIYIYIYIYCYLINCEYFNNLNEDRDMAGRGIMMGTDEFICHLYRRAVWVFGLV